MSDYRGSQREKAVKRSWYQRKKLEDGWIEARRAAARAYRRRARLNNAAAGLLCVEPAIYHRIRDLVDAIRD